MKLALITLMSCLIAVSWQQRHQQVNPYWPLPLNRGPQYHQLPYFYQEPHQSYPSFFPYYRGPYSNQQQQQFDQLQLAALLAKQQQQQLDEAAQLEKVASYNKQPVSDHHFDEEAFKKFLLDADDAAITLEEEEHSGDVNQSNLEPEGRNKLAALLLGYQIFTTTTSYTFTTSTITSTSVISCIASASFYGGSTQACRRKRSVADIEAHEDHLNPSAVQSMEPSAIYDELDLIHDREPRSTELISSLSEQPEDRLTIANSMSDDNFARAKRQFFGSTVISTVTKYSITTTSSKKTVSIGSSLSCLPTGYSLC